MSSKFEKWTVKDFLDTPKADAQEASQRTDIRKYNNPFYRDALGAATVCELPDGQRFRTNGNGRFETFHTSGDLQDSDIINVEVVSVPDKDAVMKMWAAGNDTQKVTYAQMGKARLAAGETIAARAQKLANDNGYDIGSALKQNRITLRSAERIAALDIVRAQAVYDVIKRVHKANQNATVHALVEVFENRYLDDARVRRGAIYLAQHLKIDPEKASGWLKKDTFEQAQALLSKVS